MIKTIINWPAQIRDGDKNDVLYGTLSVTERQKKGDSMKLPLPTKSGTAHSAPFFLAAAALLFAIGCSNPTNSSEADHTGQTSLSFIDAQANLKGLSRNPSCSIADVDNDGDIDILIAGYDGSDETTILYLNDGNGGFTDSHAGLLGVSFAMSAFLDVEGGSDLDLCLAGRTADDETITELYFNDGDGTFEKSSQQLKGLWAAAIIPGDPDDDGDGDEDLILCGADTNVSGKTILYLNGRF
ncbi:FG-GAP repeat domain-containing protein [Sediminispirochaeta smaragdinae]|uniref:FG-GAP repeat protein n=1 Tax=Sediminispirochaeta smaragdinae (strain DSM 11293 / JCM 15392 / SEBR 4228) TaxID=573413 RepID=E1R0W3_SEDSS|nr:VCBS repeat-containing protein [Sediminispirochaeta smaragdinae]ADK80212.1 hypothetical protein Spirs_1079 [Sediminispirochaeta smaragdinae DSM 11293]